MSLFYKQNAAARYFVDQTNGKVYEVVGGSAALLCWRNGVKEREKVAELPPGARRAVGRRRADVGAGEGVELALSVRHSVPVRGMTKTV